eukprot:8289742-Pyramimonas_sp.AAC.1
MPTKEILAYWRVVSSETELVIRRLHWRAGWAKDPQGHSQELCLLFGFLEVPGDRGGHPAGDVPSTAASPWLHRLQRDFQRAAEDLDGGQEVRSYISANPGRLTDMD